MIHNLVAAIDEGDDIPCDSMEERDKNREKKAAEFIQRWGYSSPPNELYLAASRLLNSIREAERTGVTAS